MAMDATWNALTTNRFTARRKELEAMNLPDLQFECLKRFRRWPTASAPIRQNLVERLLLQERNDQTTQLSKVCTTGS